MKIEQFIISSVVFEPIPFIFCSLDILQRCMRPMICSIFNSFLLHFELTFLRFLSQTLLWWLIFFLFIFFPLCTHSLSHKQLLLGSKQSLTFHIDLFLVVIVFSYAAIGCRLDYVTLSNVFARTVNLKMSMKLNDRVEEFILNFSLHLGIWEHAVPFWRFFSCILAMGERKLGKSLIQE